MGADSLFSLFSLAVYLSIYVFSGNILLKTYLFLDDKALEKKQFQPTKKLILGVALHLEIFYLNSKKSYRYSYLDIPLIRSYKIDDLYSHTIAKQRHNNITISKAIPATFNCTKHISRGHSSFVWV